jgi:hypothetical protein
MSKYSLNAVFVQLKLINELIYCILWKLNPVFNFSLSQSHKLLGAVMLYP